MNVRINTPEINIITSTTNMISINQIDFGFDFDYEVIVKDMNITYFEGNIKDISLIQDGNTTLIKVNNVSRIIFE